MIKEIKEKMPNWCEDTTTKFQLMMSDDIDALMCYIFQKGKFGRECEYFINSSKDRAYQSYDKTVNRKGKQYMYRTDEATNKVKDTLVLDFSINKQVKSWDNHVINISNSDDYNKLSANMNIATNINKNNYSSKFCISSFITMLSYYDIQIQNWTHEQLIFLCAIDGLYQPFKNAAFASQGEKNLHLLDFDFLVDFIKENIKEIENFDNTYLKKKSIWVNENGYLETSLDLDKLSKEVGWVIQLPSKQFKSYKEPIESMIFNTGRFPTKASIEEYYDKKIFNIALTYKGSGVVSFIN
ncbi:MAG: hypothetical protein ACLSTJ_01715 [Clostridium neonatale]